MKFSEITIKPVSGFGTPLKGDTISGQFCWQAKLDPSLFKQGFEATLKKYQKKPFAIFSSAFLKLKDLYVFKRPSVPVSFFKKNNEQSRKENIKKAKQEKSKEWMLIKDISMIDLSETEFVNEKELSKLLPPQNKALQKNNEFAKAFSQTHNTVNRLTQTTAKGEFAPYICENIFYYTQARLSLFVIFDSDFITLESIKKGLQNIGQWGFGKDASTGMGRFNVEELTELNLPKTENANACYTLAPFVPEKDTYDSIYSKIFVRFGKHGASAALKNPFKNPVIMADESAVMVPENMEDTLKKTYIGQGLTKLSKSIEETIAQGYAPYIPLKTE